MYVSLFWHTAEESMENLHHDSAPSQAVLTDNAGADRENIDNIAAVRLGTLMTRSITESDLEIVAARHFRVLDTDGNGSLDKLEFVAGMGTLFKGSIEQQWKYAFDLFDADSDGFVTHQDLAEMFNATAQVQEKMLVELLVTRDQLRADGEKTCQNSFR